jgi:hypothetical protein
MPVGGAGQSLPSVGELRLAKLAKTGTLSQDSNYRFANGRSWPLGALPNSRFTTPRGHLPVLDQDRKKKGRIYPPLPNWNTCSF